VGKMGKVFKTHDITRQQYNVLRILRGQYPNSATINIIRERMLEKMSDTSRMVVRLNNKGLIERKQSKGDRREAQVSITKKGLNLLKRMDKSVEDFNQFFENFSKDDARKLNTRLDSLRTSS
jgi:DNA-binding MarR family transcriptional regulator